MSNIKDIIIKDLELYVENLYVYERETYIELSIIKIKESFRNQGFASAIMKNLCNYADEINKPILLSPEVPDSEKNCLSNNKLISFYETFGFIPNKGKIRDYSMPSHSFKRMPNN